MLPNGNHHGGSDDAKSHRAHRPPPGQPQQANRNDAGLKPAAPRVQLHDGPVCPARRTGVAGQLKMAALSPLAAGSSDTNFDERLGAIAGGE